MDVSLIGYRKAWCFMKTLDYIILVLIIIGAVNWGLIGFFQFDLVRVIFGNMSMFSRIIYAAVGLAVYMPSVTSAGSAPQCKKAKQMF